MLTRCLIASTFPLPGYLRGADVIGETSLLVTNKAQTFQWTGCGLKVHVPQGCVPTELQECRVNVKAALTGQFEFPKGSELVSAVYWFYSPQKFSNPVSVAIQHCAKQSVSSTLSFVKAMCSQKELPYKFQPLQGGVFTSHSSYGSISLTQFSGVAVTQEGGEQLYCGRLYYMGRSINWKVHFVITKDLEAYIAVGYS